MPSGSTPQYFRTALARRKLNRLFKEKERKIAWEELLQSSASKLAAHWRGFVDRKAYMRQRSAALRIQSKIRQRHAKQMTIQMAIKQKMALMQWTELHYAAVVKNTPKCIQACRGIGPNGEEVQPAPCHPPHALTPSHSLLPPTGGQGRE